MAEKGFGVKEVNLIGASGTPTITSPNNLNLNAVNVAISTNVSIGGTLSVTGNISIGGTLTYEDVTNVDSIGVITARSGVDVDDFISVGSNIHLGNAGVITATTFSGSGASLTSIPAGQLTGTVADARISTLTASKLSGALPAISGANLTGITITPTNSDIQVVYTVTANGSSAYRFAGNGVVSTADNPDLYLIRGQKYRFINNSGGSHPFQIREASGGTAYSTGVTNNGASSGNIDFAPTFDSPAQLVYQCTSHGGMVGNIYLRDAAGGNTNVGVTTFSGSVIVADTSAFTADTGADDLIVGSTNSGINRGITILNHTGQDGRLCFGQSGDPDAGMIKYSHGSDVLQFFVESSEKLRIDSNGDLGLGIAAVPQDSGARTLHIHDTTTGGAARAAIRLTHGSSGSSASNGAFLGFDNNPDFYIYNQESGKLRFGTAGSERMRINSSGQVGVNRDTDPLNGVKFMVQNDSNNVSYFYHEGTGNNYTIMCRNDRASGSTQATQVIFIGSGNSFTGDIRSTGSSVAYNTSSDYRLKENVTPISDGITRLKTLKPSRFNFKVNKDTTVDGFLAHEVTAVPESVSGTKDEVDSDNNPVYQGIDQAKLVPLLTAALQEAITKIETLEAKVTALEGS